MSLLQKNPEKRLTVKDALEHEWLNIKKDKETDSNFKRTKSNFAIYCKLQDIWSYTIWIESNILNRIWIFVYMNSFSLRKLIKYIYIYTFILD